MNADDKALLDSLPGRKFADHLDGTAYHEAGHAVVVRALGYKLNSVVIREDDTGTCNWSRVKEDYLQRLLISWAGPRAERRVILGDADEWDGMGDDIKHIEKTLEDMDDDPRINLGTKESYKRAMGSGIQALTDTMLDVLWSDIEKLADELMARVGEEITGAEIDALLGPAIVVPVEWKAAA